MTRPLRSTRITGLPRYYETVRPMHRLHVAPSKRFAHLIVPEGGENREAVDVIVGKLLHLLSGIEAGK